MAGIVPFQRSSGSTRLSIVHSFYQCSAESHDAMLLMQCNARVIALSNLSLGGKYQRYILTSIRVEFFSDVIKEMKKMMKKIANNQSE